MYPFLSFALRVSILGLLASCSTASPILQVAPSVSAPTQRTQPEQVVQHYAILVEAVYQDALTGAKDLKMAIERFLENPSAQSLEQAKTAWLNARSAYGQSEGFRFVNGPIDNEDNGPEAYLNAWPLDEAYIDSVAGQSESGIIFNVKDYPEITAEVLRELNEKGGDKNISAGYHAVEFLLWGQDLSEGPGAGMRPFTDFTTAPQAERRKRYLQVVTQMLVEDLSRVHQAWSPQTSANYRNQFLALPAKDALGKILKGIGTLSASELASERLATPLDIGDREEEHSCFSDNTHEDVRANVLSIRHVLTGEYTRSDGTQLKGASIMALIHETESELHQALLQISQETQRSAEAIQAPFDQEIRPGNTIGRERVLSLINLLQKQGRLIVDLGARLGIVVNTDL